MQDILAIRDAQIFVGSIALALCIAWLTTRKLTPHQPIWPVRFYLFMLSGHFPRYAKSRKVFSQREQFLVSFFVWFFFLFVAGVVLFTCGGGGC